MDSVAIALTGLALLALHAALLRRLGRLPDEAAERMKIHAEQRAHADTRALQVMASARADAIVAALQRHQEQVVATEAADVAELRRLISSTGMLLRWYADFATLTHACVADQARVSRLSRLRGVRARPRPDARARRPLNPPPVARLGTAPPLAAEPAMVAAALGARPPIRTARTGTTDQEDAPSSRDLLPVLASRPVRESTEHERGEHRLERSTVPQGPQRRRAVLPPAPTSRAHARRWTPRTKMTITALAVVLTALVACVARYTHRATPRQTAITCSHG